MFLCIDKLYIKLNFVRNTATENSILLDHKEDNKQKVINVVKSEKYIRAQHAAE